jgi:succinate-semialdehyde dehydrogenase / glutarate-semialdehyde dehydrogenase
LTLVSINPANGHVLARLDEDSAPSVDAKLQAAADEFRRWRRMAYGKRSTLMVELAAVLRRDKERLATLAATEMGKPIVEAEAELEKCAWAAEFFAEQAESMLAPRAMPSNVSGSYIQYQPLGVLLEIMPWNFPFWQAFRAAIPALMGGNVALLKHASNVPQAALAIESAFRDAGFPDGAFQTLLVGSGMVEHLIADPRIAAVTLTGSDLAGSKVAEKAGKALKKCVLELGGSDPFIVLEDANIEAAATVACRARNQNNGQSCIAAKRFIVHEAIADEWETAFTQKVTALKVGDPLDRSVQVGPLARPDLVAALEDQLRRTIDAGAKRLTGGERLESEGFFFQPTVVSDVRRDMPVMREETFGPLAAVIRVSNADEALAVANDSEFGLGASVWTSPDRGRRLAGDIEAGMVFVNGMVASDVRLPFGGIKRSGLGRELSEFGIREFQNLQMVWVADS